MKIRIRVPATSANLGPGFDVMGAALKLYNEIEIEKKAGCDKGENFIIHGEGKAVLPKDGRNIVIKAMKAVFEKAAGKNWKKKYNLDCYKIKQKNNIPIGSGLGSSAAAYLCGILAANEISGKKLSLEDIISLGIELEGHSDNIIPALVGGLCVSVSGNPKEKYIKLKTPVLKAVVINPGFQIETERSRRLLPKNVSMSDAVHNCEKAALFVAAVQNSNYKLLSEAMQDRLHQPYRSSLIPGMKKVFETAINSGAFGAALSGSGPSIIALSPGSKAKKIGNNMQRVWKNFKIKSNVFILDFDKEGAKVWH